MTPVLTRRRLLVVGASCATAAALRGLATPAVSAEGTARPGEQVLEVARREVQPAGQREQGIVANQTFPSHELRAREGDLLRVIVDNQLDEPTALHLHGAVLPSAMDGVAGLTQPLIEPKAKFAYEFPLREAGTYFYESTWKLQRQLGLYGALVVVARSEPFAVDHDEVLLLSDWTNGAPAQIVPELRAGRTQDPTAEDPQRLINALPDGTPFPIDVRYNAYLLNGRSHRDAWTKEVEPGQRLRLRLINASAATFFRFQLEGHALQVVAADGRAVAPVEVDDLVLAPGERYDVLVTIREAGSYTLRAAALGASGGAVGVLHTPGVRPVVSTRPPRWGPRALTYQQLRLAQDVPFAGAATERLSLTIEGDSAGYTWSFDGHPYPGEFIAARTPEVPPVALACDAHVELALVNRTSLWQPVHLHGFRFRLLAAPDSGTRAPWKDTVAVAPGATQRLVFDADQPGRWLLQSSNLYRAQSGLTRVLAVARPS
jgi:FtsP/CotA-like multicopper oxidase with cupredoxin domain